MAPVVVLERPTLSENIGTTARAMANCGVGELRMVEPCGGGEWLTGKARAACSGADWVLEGAKVYGSLEEATSDLTWLAGVSARRRDLVKPIWEFGEAVERGREKLSGGGRAGFVFGGERSGLSNESVSLCDGLAWIPSAPDFGSFNLAQAVLLVCHYWWRGLLGRGGPPEGRVGKGVEAANREEMGGLFEQLEASLDAAGFLREGGQRRVMVMNLRAMLLRGELTVQEVRTLRGVVTALVRLDAGDLGRRFGGKGG